MNNERFQQKMAALEQERDKFLARLTPEDQQEYKQKEVEFSKYKDDTKVLFNFKNKQSDK